MQTAIEYWKQRVEGHYLQSTKIQGKSLWASSDFWQPLMANFKVDPHRANDEVLDHLVNDISEDATVIDVGGGAGRFALPLALKCKHVVVVEPADSMIEALNEVTKESGIDNVTVVQKLWEDAEVEPADIVLSAHSVYGVAEPQGFIRKLESKAKQKVIIVAYLEQPQTHFSPFWKPLYGEDRIDLPALHELMKLLWELDIHPNLEMFPPSPVPTFENHEVAFQQLKHRLHVEDGSQEEHRLRSAIPELLVETSTGLAIKGAKLRRLGVLTWTP
jgi:hypothetical protein